MFGGQVLNASPPPGLRRSGYGPTVRVSSSDVRISVDGFLVPFEQTSLRPVRSTEVALLLDAFT